MFFDFLNSKTFPNPSYKNYTIKMIFRMRCGWRIHFIFLFNSFYQFVVKGERKLNDIHIFWVNLLTLTRIYWCDESNHNIIFVCSKWNGWQSMNVLSFAMLTMRRMRKNRHTGREFNKNSFNLEFNQQLNESGDNEKLYPHILPTRAC